MEGCGTVFDPCYSREWRGFFGVRKYSCSIVELFWSSLRDGIKKKNWICAMIVILWLYLVIAILWLPSFEQSYNCYRIQIKVFRFKNSEFENGKWNVTSLKIKILNFGNFKFHWISSNFSEVSVKNLSQSWLQYVLYSPLQFSQNNLRVPNSREKLREVVYKRKDDTHPNKIWSLSS